MKVLELKGMQGMKARMFLRQRSSKSTSGLSTSRNSTSSNSTCTKSTSRSFMKLLVDFAKLLVENFMLLVDFGVLNSTSGDLV